MGWPDGLCDTRVFSQKYWVGLQVSGPVRFGSHVSQGHWKKLTCGSVGGTRFGASLLQIIYPSPQISIALCYSMFFLKKKSYTTIPGVHIAELPAVQLHLLKRTLTVAVLNQKQGQSNTTSDPRKKNRHPKKLKNKNRGGAQHRAAITAPPAQPPTWSAASFSRSAWRCCSWTTSSTAWTPARRRRRGWRRG